MGVGARESFLSKKGGVSLGQTTSKVVGETSSVSSVVGSSSLPKVPLKKVFDFVSVGKQICHDQA